METVTVSVPMGTEHYAALSLCAGRLGVSVEEFIRMSTQSATLDVLSRTAPESATLVIPEGET